MFGFPVLKAENIAEFVSKKPETFFAVVKSDGSVSFYETKDQKFGQQSLLTFEEWGDVDGVADGVDFLPPDSMFAANAAGRVHRNK
jgi:hypothetical protein